MQELPIKPRWENYAQEVAAGVAPYKAYGKHCYRGNKEKPSRAALQCGASQLNRNPIVSARIAFLQRENAHKMRMSAEEIIMRIEDLAMNAKKEKVRLDALVKLYEIGGHNRNVRQSVRYVLEKKIVENVSPTPAQSAVPRSGESEGGDSILI